MERRVPDTLGTSEASAMDRDLVELAQRGDREAFALLARARGDWLFAVAQRILRDFHRAEDAVQQALVIAWQELPTLRDPDRFEPWLRRLIVRVCYVEARRARRYASNIRTLPISDEPWALGPISLPPGQVVGALLSLEIESGTTKVALDDAEAFELDLYNVVVANGRYVAGGIPVAPEADLADGLLDIVLIAERGPAELAILAAQILLGKHLSADGIIFRRAKRIVISSRPGMWFNVDGELIGNEPATFELLPQALRCVVGAA
jgi:DNA-directed RNA polymerase specialized sigma24 family protein